jgi:hypothetical protein
MKVHLVDGTYELFRQFRNAHLGSDQQRIDGFWGKG